MKRLTLDNYTKGHPLHSQLARSGLVFKRPPLTSLTEVDLKTIPPNPPAGYVPRSLIPSCKVVGRWEVDLPNLRVAKRAWANSTLSSFKGDLSSLLDGEDAFCYNSRLCEFDTPLPNLVNGYGMFNNVKLLRWNQPLPRLQNGFFMFFGNLFSSWDTDLPELVDGRYMFGGAKRLTRWSGALPKLEDGRGMFRGSGLVSFKELLPSLLHGDEMFYGCRLDGKSVQKIAEGIRDVNGDDSSTKNLGLGVRSKEGIDDALELLRKKGWNVTLQQNDEQD